MGAIGGKGVSIEEALPLDGSQAMTGPLSLTISDTDNVVGLSVTQNDTTNNPNAGNITNAGTGNGLFINQDGNGLAINIDSESTTVGVVDISGPRNSSAIALNIDDVNQLTTGGIARFHSNGGLTNVRNLVEIENQNTAATGATSLTVIQSAVNQCMILDQNAASSFIDYQGTAAANTTDPVSTLTTSGAIQGHLQIEVNGVKRWLAFLADPS